MHHLIGYKCSICGQEYGPDEVEYVCPKHGDEGVLDAVYDYAAISQQLDPARLADWQTSAALNLFRYKPLLPIDSESENLPLHIGWTPLYRAPRLEALLGIREVWIKDDGRNPTASFKDRASQHQVASGHLRAADCAASQGGPIADLWFDRVPGQGQLRHGL
jgi:threonine synthase